MTDRNVSVRGKKKIVLATSYESMGSKGKRGILFSGLVVVVTFFMVWAGAAIGSMISPPNQIVLQNQSIAQYVNTNNSSAIPFANVNGLIEYAMPTGQHVSYIETNVTLAELNSRDAGKIVLNLSQASVIRSASPATVHPDAMSVSPPTINFTETGLPAGTKWGVTSYISNVTYTSNTSYLKIPSFRWPSPYEIFPQSADPSTSLIYAAGSRATTNISIVFHAPQPTYYIYSLSRHGTVTVSKLHTANAYFMENYTGEASLTNVSTIDVGSKPVAMQTVGAYTYVLNSGSSNISVIKGMKLFGTISLPSGSKPNAMDVLNGTMYVTGNATNSLYLVGLANMTIYKTIALTKGTNPVGLSVQSAPASRTLSGKNKIIAFVPIANGTGNGTMAMITFTGSSDMVSYYPMHTPDPTGMISNSFADRACDYMRHEDSNFVLETSFPSKILKMVFVTNSTSPLYFSTNCSVSTDIQNFTLLPSPFFIEGHGGIIATNATKSVIIPYDTAFGLRTAFIGGSPLPPYNSVLSLPNGLTVMAQNSGLDFISQTMGNTTFHSWDPIALTDSVVGNYSITLNEKGLPADVNWTVTIGNTTQTSNTTSMTFYASNGTYSYSAKFVNYTGSNGIVGYNPFFNGTGAVVINGSSISITVGYEPGYGVTFIPKNLPTGTSWTLAVTTNVTVNASNKIFSSANNTRITTTAGELVLPLLNSTITGKETINGTLVNVTYTMRYSYSISSPNYISSPSVENFTVDQGA